VIRNPFIFILGFLISLASFNGCAHHPSTTITKTTTKTTTITTQTAAIPIPEGPTIFHTVSSGETLPRIAETYSLDEKKLMLANHLLDASQLELGQKLLIPGATSNLAVHPKILLSLDQVKERIGTWPDSYWRTITIHHSATPTGGMTIFDNYHRRRKMGGLAYHFVIDNGSPLTAGDIEVGWRWTKQVKADRAYDIQVCLVGNFDDQHLSDVQMDSLVKLIYALCDQFHISYKNIRRHRDIKHTECPGNHFPFERVVQEVEQFKA
jgi:LysM repeat protein